MGRVKIEPISHNEVSYIHVGVNNNKYKYNSSTPKL